jgi:hypothetical protein
MGVFPLAAFNADGRSRRKTRKTFHIISKTTYPDGNLAENIKTAAALKELKQTESNRTGNDAQKKLTPPFSTAQTRIRS